MNQLALPTLKRPTGLLGVLIGILLIVLAKFGVEMPVSLAIALVVLPAAAVSYLAPRWAKAHGLFYKHPAALSGAAAAVLIFVAYLFGVSFSVEEATLIVSGVIGLVSLPTPRSEQAVPTADLDRPGVGE